MLLFWLPLAAFLFWLGGIYFKKSSRQDEEDPLQILKKRYAQGEISKSDFEQMKKDLRQTEK